MNDAPIDASSGSPRLADAERRLLDFSAGPSLGLDMEAAELGRAIANQLQSRPLDGEAALEAWLGNAWRNSVAVLPAGLEPTVLRPWWQTGDVLLLDRQGAARHRLAVDALRAEGWHVEVAEPESLEAKVSQWEAENRSIWLLADHVDARTGRRAPIEAWLELVDRHPGLHLVLDDSGTIGWQGAGGRGELLARGPLNERVFMTASLGRAWGLELSVMVGADAVRLDALRDARQIRPEHLAKGLTQAERLGPQEIEAAQARFQRRLQVCTRSLKAHRLPLLGADDGPVKLVAMGQPAVAYAMVHRLMEEGFLASAVMVPGEQGAQAALRFVVSLAHPLGELQSLLEAIARHLPAILAEKGIEPATLGMAPPPAPQAPISLDAWRTRRILGATP